MQNLAGTAKQKYKKSDSAFKSIKNQVNNVLQLVLFFAGLFKCCLFDFSVLIGRKYHWIIQNSVHVKTLTGYSI